MGGKPKQVDPGVAQSSSAGAERAANASADLSNLNRTEQEKMFGMFFGSPGTPGSTGTLSQFLDPNSITSAASSLQGPYAQAWNQAEGQIAKNYSLQRGALAQAQANRGFSAGMPSGFAEQQNQQLARDEADTRGSTYTTMLGQGYQDALNNFWNATNIGSGQAAGAREGALQGSQNAGTTNAQLYSTAGQQSNQPNLLGAGISSAGTVGAAFCPARGSKITLADGRRKPVELLVKGDKILQLGGKSVSLLVTPVPIEQPVVQVITAGHRQARVSLAHCFVLQEGGYTYAGKCVERWVASENGKDEVVRVMTENEGKPMHDLVYPLELEGNHTFLADGLWSLN